MHIKLTQSKCPAILTAIQDRYGGNLSPSTDKKDQPAGSVLTWHSAVSLQSIIPVLLPNSMTKHVKLACVLRYAADISLEGCAAVQCMQPLRDALLTCCCRQSIFMAHGAVTEDLLLSKMSTEQPQHCMHSDELNAWQPLWPWSDTQ